MALLLTSIADILVARQQTVTCAESCTGGGIAAAFTDVAGSSQWFEQSWVTYSNGSKTTQLNVTQQSLQQFGAVSASVVEQMAVAALNKANADWAVATSGIAGPGGGSKDKPVGTVWFAFASGSGTNTVSICKHFSGDRAEVRAQAVTFCLEHLLSLMRQAVPL